MAVIGSTTLDTRSRALMGSPALLFVWLAENRSTPVSQKRPATFADTAIPATIIRRCPIADHHSKWNALAPFCDYV